MYYIIILYLYYEFIQFKILKYVLLVMKYVFKKDHYVIFNIKMSHFCKYFLFQHTHGPTKKGHYSTPSVFFCFFLSGRITILP
jgi:hypothetical protein